ncbi:MAG: hypothetical protein LLG01_05810 [Planctomycetaceae bacterium]|nr:hypothetical protein [Planctomycetaceae bacterium]
MKHTYWLMMVAALGAMGSPAAGQDEQPAVAPAAAPAVELGERFIDPAHGFSLKTPLGTVRQRGFSTARLVSWSMRDDKSNAIVWTFSVLQVIPAKSDAAEKKPSLEDYRKLLETQLQQTGQYKIESAKVMPLAGKGAIDVRGVTQGPITLWKRQVWVLADPDRFLVFLMAGPTVMKDSLDAICSQMLATLQITDPTEARKAMKDHLARGVEMMAAVNDKKVSEALSKEPQWYLWSYKGKVAGFMHVSEEWTTQDKQDGVQVKTCVLMEIPGDQRRLSQRQSFSSPRGEFERWSQAETTGTGPQTARVFESGLKKEDVLVCQMTAGGRSRTEKQQVPNQIYLPKPLAWMFFRLVDLKKPATYSLACYASAENNFDMRTLSVIGPDVCMRSGMKVQAIRVSDQAAADAEAATLWLDAKGAILQMKSGSDLVMELSSEEAVLRHFPAALTLAAQAVPSPPPVRMAPLR